MKLPNFKFPWKGVLIGFGAVLGVLIVGAVLFVVFFPKDAAIAEAEKQIEAATDRDLSIGGDVDLTFWPSLGFSAEAVSLSNPEGFGDTPFVSAKRMVFAVALMPLLGGDIEVKRLIVEGADLNLMARTNGDSNWTFPAEEQSPEQQAKLKDLSLDDVRMLDSRITFQGPQGEPLIAEDVDATLALVSLDQPAEVEAALTYRGQRLETLATIAAPRAILEQGETPLKATLASAPLNGEFDGVFHSVTGALTGSMKANGDSLRALMDWIGSPMAPGSGFGPFRVEARMAHEGETTALTQGVFAIDAIEARGDVNIIAPENGLMRVTGALATGALNANPYLPPPAQASAGAAAGDAAGVNTAMAWSTDPIDLAGLKAINTDLNFTIGALQFQQLKFTDVAMNLVIQNGIADARLSRISLYGGGGTARLQADATGAAPRIATELDVQNIQALDLLRDAIGFDKIEGRGRLRASFTGTGSSQAAIMQTLRGAAGFAFNDGAYKGVNLALAARTIQGALSGQAVGGGASTDFAEMAANFQIANGVAVTEDLRLLNPFVRLDGAGLIDIGRQTIDMRVAPRAVSSIEGQGGQAGMQGLGVPFRVSGPWTQPGFRVDIGDAVQNELRNRARAALGDSPFSNIFGGGPATPAPAAPPAEGQPAPAPQPAPRDPVRDALGGLFGRD